MEIIELTVKFNCDHPPKSFSGPRSLVEEAFFNYVDDNKELWEEAYIKVRYDGLAVVSYNKLPIFALKECYDTLFFHGPPIEPTRIDKDDLEESIEEIVDEDEENNEEENEPIDETEITNDRIIDDEVIITDDWGGTEEEEK